jgi:hypothetical protein
MAAEDPIPKEMPPIKSPNIVVNEIFDIQFLERLMKKSNIK